MATRNTQSSRFYSNKQEQYIAKEFNGKQTVNSGSAKFNGGDVVLQDFLIEAKTTMTPKKSFSIKKDWIEKVEQERKGLQIPHSALVFQFEPDGENFFVVNEKLFKDMYKCFIGDEQNEN